MEWEDIGGSRRGSQCGRGYSRVRSGNAGRDSVAEIERHDPRLSDVFEQYVARGRKMVFGEHTDSDVAEIDGVRLIHLLIKLADN